MRRSRLSGTQFSSNAVNSIPLSFLPWKPWLIWWPLSVNSYFLVFISIFAEKLKNKASFEGQHQSRGDAKMSIAIMLISSDLICIIWQGQKKILRNRLSPYFLDRFPGCFAKMLKKIIHLDCITQNGKLSWQNHIEFRCSIFKIIMQKYAL